MFYTSHIVSLFEGFLLCDFDVRFQMSDLSALATRTEFEEQKTLIEELQSRLTEAEVKIIEGESLRKKLHNTILVMILCNIFFWCYSDIFTTKLFPAAGTKREHPRFL